MHSAIAAFVLAFLVTTFATPIVRRVAVGAGVVDAPGGRRVHEFVTPRLGGVAVMTGFFATLAVFAVVKTAVMRGFLERPDLLIGLVLGGIVVGLVGAIDDVKSLGPWMKLGAQTVAAVIAYAFGYRIDAVNIPILGDLYIGTFALPLTVIWFLAITNAINLIDGLDGLAVGIAFSATVANFAIAFMGGAQVTVLLSATLGGALLAFLRFNFNPATIFLGDSGSMFLGYTLAATSIAGQMTKSSTAITILAPVIALGVPIVDTLLAMVRRTVARRSIFAADRGHIHHRLLDLGFTHRRVVLTLYSMSVALAAAAVTVAIGHHASVGAALTLVGIVLFAVVRAIAGRRGVVRDARAQRQLMLDTLSNSTRASVSSLEASADEASMRDVLREWSLKGHGLFAELSPIDSTSSADARVYDISSETRRRFVVVHGDGRLPITESAVVPFVDDLADACRLALRRAKSHSNTARLMAVPVVGEK